MHRKIRFAAILFTAVCLKTTSQPDTMPVGIHQAESEYYSGVFDTMPLPGNRTYETPSVLKSTKIAGNDFMVFGWHPYWASPSAYLAYDYDVLTHIAYFSFEVDTASGDYITLRGWDSTPLIDYAHQRGVKVILTVTNFGSARNTELLTDTVKQWRLIGSLINQLRSRNGDGVNFDLESVPAAMKDYTVSFCRRAVRGIKAELPDAEISFATPAVNWSDGWNLGALANLCDYVIMMGYNYYWSGSSTAGPVSPLAGETYNITRSLEEEYLDAGVLPRKLLLGVPWYGYDWPVTSNARKATATASGTSRTYNSALLLADTYGKTFDEITSVPWLAYQNGTEWRQMWFDDSLSLQLKSNLAKSMNLAGIGIWALSYEAGRQELWKGLMEIISGPVSSAGDETMADQHLSQIIMIAPNPASDDFEIKYSISDPGQVTLRIYNISGRLAASPIDCSLEPGLYSETINAGSFAPGVYICVLNTPSGKSMHRFTVISAR